MIILDTAGDTLQAEASAASSITVSAYGIKTTGGSDSYKRLGVSQLTGAGTQDTIYTVPANTVVICSMIIIANTSASTRTIKLWDVENGGSPGDANAILGTVDISANSSILWNKGNIKEIPTIGGSGGADEKVKIDSGATAGYIGAASNDGVLRTSSPLIYTDGGDFITLSLDAGLTDLAGVAMVADKFYYTSGDNTHVAGTVTTFARSILDDADEATFKATVNLVIGTNVLAEQTIGIADDNLLEVDDADAADNDYAKFTANGLEGRSYAEVLSDIGAAVAFGRPVILTPQSGCPPASNFATLDTMAGGSTPAEVIPVLDFDADASEYMDFKFVLPAGYASGGLTITVIFSMTSDHDEGTPHKVRWEIAFRRIQDDTEDINGAHSYAYNGVGATVPSVVGEISYDDITFTDGADMDSLAAGEMAILRIYRDHDHADDNATGDAELQMIIIKET